MFVFGVFFSLSPQPLHPKKGAKKNYEQEVSFAFSHNSIVFFPTEKGAGVSSALIQNDHFQLQRGWLKATKYTVDKQWYSHREICFHIQNINESEYLE